jgi:ribosome-associated toxin RatA of RatAB toxin-antitoxin module
VIEKFTTTNKLDIQTDKIGDDDACSEADLELDANANELDLAAVQVEVEKVAERQRQITATIEIPHPPEAVWQVLTNYEALPDFIPNLATSRRLDHPRGGIRIEQIGCQRLMKMNFSARVVLDLEESFPQEINFQMVEGDLKAFSGTWLLTCCSNDDKAGTRLCYRIFVHPKITMPVGMIERRLSHDLKVNLLAIRDRVISLTQEI